VGHVPVHTNPMLRKSRLVRSIPDYVKKSMTTIVRIWALYEPLKIFTYIGGVFIFIGMWGIFWLLYHWAIDENFNWFRTFTGHLPTTFAAVLGFVFGIQIILIGLVADILAASRRLTEETLYRVKRMDLELAELQRRGQTLVTTLQEHGLDGAATAAPVEPPTTHPAPISGERETTNATPEYIPNGVASPAGLDTAIDTNRLPDSPSSS